MAISQPYSGTFTVSTTELSLISGTSTLQSNATAGIYEVMIDLNALASGDSFTLSFKEMTKPAGTQHVIDAVVFAGAQANPVYVAPSMLLINGWDVTLIKNQGTDRAIDYSIRQVA